MSFKDVKNKIRKGIVGLMALGILMSPIVKSEEISNNPSKKTNIERLQSSELAELDKIIDKALSQKNKDGYYVQFASVTDYSSIPEMEKSLIKMGIEPEYQLYMDGKTLYVRVREYVGTNIDDAKKRALEIAEDFGNVALVYSENLKTIWKGNVKAEKHKKSEENVAKNIPNVNKKQDLENVVNSLIKTSKDVNRKDQKKYLSVVELDFLIESVCKKVGLDRVYLDTLLDLENKPRDQYAIGYKLVPIKTKKGYKFVEKKINGKKIPTGAVGLTQIKASTASEVLDRQVTEKELLENPELNLYAGALYLKEHLEDTNYDIKKALARYNAGKRGAKRNYAETKIYIERGINTYSRYKN